MSLRRELRFLLLACLSPVILYAQASESTPTSSAPIYPYIAHFKITRTTVMPDGSTWTTVSVETVARNSKGRFYSETKSLPPSEDQGPQTASTSAYKLEPENRSIYYVEDPAASTFVHWDSKSNRASLYQYPEELHGKLKGCWANSEGTIQSWGPEDEDWHAIPVSTSLRSTSKVWIREPDGVRRHILLTTENLGTKMIDRFSAQGVRMSYSPLPGEQADDLTQSSSEFWKSQALDLKLSEKSTGMMTSPKPAKYTKTKELIDLKLSEPDPLLFSLPKDYSVDRIELHQVPCERR